MHATNNSGLTSLCTLPQESCGKHLCIYETIHLLEIFVTGNLLRPWSNYNNVQLGLFLSALMVIYKVPNCVGVKWYMNCLLVCSLPWWSLENFSR